MEESDRIQVFTAEILYEFIDIFDGAFHVFSSFALIFTVVISGNFPCILNRRQAYIAVFNLFVVMQNSMTGIRIFSGSK